ncbi:MAG: hypothetical protein FWG03_03265, partial [Clostridiales bacterium]|nr:hypothetical protein [Clostridiales bacterium]
FVYLAAAIPLSGAHTVSIIRYSPDHQNKLVLHYDAETGKTALLKQSIFWFAQYRDIFPFTASDGNFKTQWLVDDVCAVTYMSDDDGSIHQYVATYGARGDDAGYASPYTVVASLGWRTELTDAVWSIETSHDGIGIRQGTETTLYSWRDCVPFGTTAVVLCRNGSPEWTIALNKDCVVEYGFAKGGCSITLCRVSMEKTAPVVFQSTNPGGAATAGKADYIPKGTPGGNPETTMQCDYYINNNRIFFTKDYGESWIPCDLPEDAVTHTLGFYNTSYILPEGSYSISADSPVIALLYDGHPSLRISIDNGKTWDTRPAGFIPDGMDRVDYYMNPFTKRFVHFFDAQNGYIWLCSDYSMGTGMQRRAYRTSDGGATWEEISLPTVAISELGLTSGDMLTGLVFADRAMENGVCTLKRDLDTEGYPDVFFTQDGGSSWEGIELPWDALPPNNDYLKKVYSASVKEAWWEICIGYDVKRVMFAANSPSESWRYLSTKTVTVHTVG